MDMMLPGAPYGFNGKITHASLGSIYICVGAIRRTVSINTSEDAASQAKTMYPLWVSQGVTTLRLLHKDHQARDLINDWLATFMEQAGSAQLENNYVDVSVPVRDFQRRAVPQGTLVYGKAVEDGMLTTMLTLIGAADPVRRYTERSRMQLAANGALVSTYFYPAGIQAGYSSAEAVYDRPGPIRPGMPDQAV